MEETLSIQVLPRFAEESAKDEFTDYTIYTALSRSEKNPKFKQALQELASAEWRHYEFWKTYTPHSQYNVNRLRVYLVLALRFLLGLTFTLKFLERHEDDVIRRYKSIEPSIPDADSSKFRGMVDDEEKHENYLMGEIEDERVKYMSFIVLGLADAVVEVAAIHAGSLGIYNRTELAGLAGVVAGMAASIAMASAAYAQAKQGFSGSARKSAVYTGVSYMVTAFFLALPYFLTVYMLNALLSSLAVGMILVAFVTYYDSIISGRGFRRQFVEIASIILAATAALYLAGLVIRNLFGITI